MKTLTNDQRQRLEQIANDEFRMRENEISTKKNKIFMDWQRAETDKVRKAADVKNIVTMTNKIKAIQAKYSKQGFSIATPTRTNDMSISIAEYSSVDNYGSRPPVKAHPKYNTMKAASRVNRDEFLRARNKVMTAIWSMEKPFAACVKLIEASVNKIK